MSSEAIINLSERLIEACNGDFDLARKALDDAARRREKFRQEVVLITKQLFLGKTAPAPKIAGAVSTAIHAPFNKVLRIIQKEFEVLRGTGIHVV